ncbi:ABC transporter permease [Janthinobacterium sp.]|uniref:ABC transporter permease n=1 Tax=Janthinobacterium sp. TaxID=1871054 RepID=UPI00293D53B9|nr:ABC transporter permease [Janthinobacterium sp.]
MHGLSAGFGMRLRALLRKEFRQLLRDPGNLAIGIVLPIVLILLFGYGLSLDVRNAPIAVVLEDAAPQAREAVSGLLRSPYFSAALLPSMREAEELMRARRVDAIVRLRGDFSARQAAGQGAAQLILHGADANRARIVAGYVQGALAQPALRRAERSAAAEAAPGRVVVEQRLWFNSANTSTWYLVPGLIVLIMTLVGAFLTALVMAREWERGTLEALFVTPVRPSEILLGKVIPYFCVGMVGLALCLLAARFLFAVPMVGSLALIVLVSMLYLLVALGLGLVISAATRSQFLASQFALVLSFMPALMLSGFLFDLRSVPAPIRLVGHLLPATYYIELLKTLLLSGNNWPLIAHHGAVLAAYAVLLLALARRATRKSLD